MTFPIAISASQANKEEPISAMFRALKPFALGGENPTTPDGTTGLYFGVHGGPMPIDGVLTTIADQKVLLGASTTSYVEFTRAGVLSANTTEFTPGRIPLYVVTTSASGVASFVEWRVWQDLPGVHGRCSVAVTTADVTLNAVQARCDIINVSGLLTGNRALIVPNGPQQWAVFNNTTGAFSLTVKTAAGTGKVITQGKSADLVSDGTNVEFSNNDVAAIGGALQVANNLSDVSNAATARTNLGLGTAAVLASDTDTALGADSDARVATQKAVKAYIDSLGLAGFNYLIDTSSTAATDPTAGLLKFNHATPASVTELYVDDSTSDAVDLSTLLASLGSSGLVKLTSTRDVGEWVVFKWTATPTDNTGWWTFTVVHQAGLGTFEDDDEVQVLFLQLGASAGGITDGDKGDITVSGSGTVFTVDNDVVTNAKAANMATATFKGRLTAGTGDPEDLTFNQARQLLNKKQVLVDGANIAVDADLGLNCRVVLGGNRTLDNPTNLVDGDVLNFRIHQDGTGSRTLAYGSKYKFAAGAAPVLSTAASSRDFMSCQYDSTDDTLNCSMLKAFA